MPMYEYKCDGCKRTFEVERRIAEPALTVCARSIPCHACNGGRYRRVRREGLGRRELERCETCDGNNFVTCGAPVKCLIPSST